MIKHIVMWKLKEGVHTEALSEFKAMLENMKGKVAGLQTLEVGVNSVPLTSACDLVLYTTFDSMESLSRYQNHPEHLRVKQMAKAWVSHRHQVDYLCKD